MNLTKPRREIDRKYKRLVMANETCVVAQSMLRLITLAKETAVPRLADALQYPSFDEKWSCEGSYEFHHVKPKGGGIMGSKVSDRRGVKVCLKHHKMAAERRRFEQDFVLSLEAEIAHLNEKYPKDLKGKPSTRHRQAIAKVKIIGCLCGKPHTLPFSKAEAISGNAVYFHCPVTNKQVKATI